MRPLEALGEEIRRCSRCNLGKLRDQESWEGVPGHGRCPSPVMFVGEGPGAEEARQGLPFVGPAGRRLDEALAEAGIERGECFVTNVVKCRPPKNRAPSSEEAATCGAWLAAQVALVDPAVVVTLGGPALAAVTGKALAVSKVRGSLLKMPGFAVYPTFHPAYALRNQEGDARMRGDLAKLAAWLRPRHPEVLA